MANTDKKILVWDAPVRVFHWLMVLSFAGAWLTAESERWRLIHVTLGYTLGGLVAFRIVWGLVGTRYARFAEFVRGPAAIKGYLQHMLRLAGLVFMPRPEIVRQQMGAVHRAPPEHHVGHNPAGAVAIVLMLLASVVIVATGWASYNDINGNWIAELHEGAATFMLAVVFVHVAGVALASWLHHENLVRAMLDGKKEGAGHQGIARSWSVLAVILLMAVMGFWWLQWRGAV
ncbi:MAG: cytochrome b/b6 domain-containing protein [Pseudomonadota bacterium]